MQDLPSSRSNAEINLHELFVTLWAFKFLIAGICALSVTLCGYYVLKADKEYTSVAIFKLEKSNSNGLSIDGQLGALANFTGFGTGGSSMNLPKGKITGRIFIESLNEELNFLADPYYNKYISNSNDPIWKSYLKLSIGWQNPSAYTREAEWQSIIKRYSKSVTIDESIEGTVKISVNHRIPERAANVANAIMNTIISDTKSSKDNDQDQMLSYLSNTLANALSDLEISQSNLKEFALKNSALPLESFASKSLELDALREQLNRTSELHQAVAALLLLLENKTTDQNDYLTLRQRFPIVDQVEFRRVLGQNEIISSWSWPEASSVTAIFDTLSERKSRLQSQINTSQKEAERSGLALETYGKLERNAKISEATYTVLIEQVKAKSTLAGFRPDRSEVYEYASVSIIPSAPKTNLILAVGAVLGLFIGSILSLFLAFQRGVYYSRDSLISKVQAPLTGSLKTILPLRGKSLEYINTIFIKKPYSVLRDMVVEIHNSDTTQVVVTSTRAKLTSNDVACALASYIQSDTMKVAVIDFSSRAKMLDKEKLFLGSFIVTEHVGNVSILRPDNNMAAIELLSQRNFTDIIQSLESTIDLLFLCADDEDAISLLRALQGQKTFHISLARTKYTKSITLAQICSLLPIQGLLHE